MKRKIFFGAGITLLIFVIAFVGYSKWIAPTKIAFVNYQAITLGNIHKINNNSWVKIYDISLEELHKLSKYDMVFVNGMGLRIVEEQRDLLKKIADKGTPFYTFMATNPDNNICNLDSTQISLIYQYLQGGKKNYRNLLNYIRKEIDGKKIYVKDSESPVKRAFDIIYHPYIGDSKDEEDDLEFNTVSEYEKWLKEKKIWKEGGKKIAITGQMADPTDLIKALQQKGMNVYPIAAFRKFYEFIEDISPDMVINMPHGRMGDNMVQWLEQNNIPLLAPITVPRLVDDWENDPMGMSGGFLSQSVVMPEIDGAIRSFVLFAQYKDEDGYQHSFAVPERLETFVETVENFLVLKDKPNNEKRIAIYYFKGPGQGSAMVAGGMEVAPSLYNLLKRLKDEGYKVDNLPSNHKEFERMIMTQGSVLGVYAEGAIAEFMKNGNPELINKTDYEAWVAKSLRPEKYKEVVDANGEFPGQYMVSPDGRLAVARIQFGNVVILPQNAAGAGNNAFKIAHGTDAAPPHPYIASYLWTKHKFKADAIFHFGTHGSLEFTPKKQVALSNKDWPDRLIGNLPHIYIYTIGNVGEGIIAKRRSYATLTTYLTPPFLESNVRGLYRDLTEKLKIYNNIIEDYGGIDNITAKGKNSRIYNDFTRASLAVKAASIKLGIHRDLELDSIAQKPYTEGEISRIENFAEELANEKITGQLYTLGVPYEEVRIKSTIQAIATDAIAYSVWILDKMKKRTSIDAQNNKPLFTKQYLNPSLDLVNKLIKQPAIATDELICRTAKITTDELKWAREVSESKNKPSGMMAAMMGSGNTSKNKANMPQSVSNKLKQENPKEAMGAHPQGKSHNKNIKKDTALANNIVGGHPQNIKKEASSSEHQKSGSSNPHSMSKTSNTDKQMPQRKSSMGGGNPMGENKTYTKEEYRMAEAILEIERTIKNVGKYKQYLIQSPNAELAANLNALTGGYIAPSPGGDPIANPNTLPTGRNMYSVNAEATPSEAAWEKGMRLANNTIDLYRQRHNGEYPRKVSYTLWSGEFIETEGATIAQILYMLGVEPIRDAFGRVTDLRLIDSEELGRPRIDVVVQTSGQLRDLAASRLFLINRAVEMASEAKDDKYENRVTEGVNETQRALLDKGLSPREAKEIAAYRVFGGVNGGYGTGIQGMVESGDRWEDESEIAETYINNMGAFYGSEKNWEQFRQFAFEAALTRTDVVIQPRQSNTWGTLSLDHMYEFMGGLNLAVRNVTGKDPDAYLSDYRNRNNVRMQEVKEAIGVEARTTILNPTYIKEKMKGEASSAGVFGETMRNTYAWNVMKPSAIDNELWDEIYNVYIKDKFNLDIEEFFKTQNPAALQEITAVMMETIRKGYWKASEEQIADIAKKHIELVKEHQPSCSGFVCDNMKLKEFIASKTDVQTAKEYKQSISKVRQTMITDKDGKSVVLQKDNEKNISENTNTSTRSNIIIALVIAMVLTSCFIIIRKRRNKR